MDSTAPELRLHDYLGLLGRRKYWLVGAALLVFGLVLVFTLRQDEEFRSVADVLVRTEETDALFPSSAALPADFFVQSLAAELAFASGREFREAATEATGFVAAVEVAPKSLTAPDAVLAFTVLEPTPERAGKAANAHADTYVEMRHAIFEENVGGAFEADLAVARAELVAVEEAIGALSGPVDRYQELIDANDDPNIVSFLIGEQNLQRAEAAALAVPLVAQRDELVARIDDLEEALEVVADPEVIARVLNPGGVPQKPVSPDVPRNLILGAVAALVLGLAVAIVRDLVKPRVGDTVAEAGDTTMLLGTIPVLKRDRRQPGRVAAYADLRPGSVDAYRGLRNSVLQLRASHGVVVVAVTSGANGVGKTQTVANLAHALARNERVVLVVDADLRGASLGPRLGEETDAGLAELLGGDVSMGYFLQESPSVTVTVVHATRQPNMFLIGAGQGRSTAVDLIGAESLQRLFAKVREEYDVVLVDCPPLFGDPNTALIAGQADAAIVVYDATRTTRGELDESLRLLEAADVRVAGTVANRSRTRRGYVPVPSGDGGSVDAEPERGDDTGSDGGAEDDRVEDSPADNTGDDTGDDKADVVPAEADAGDE